MIVADFRVVQKVWHLFGLCKAFCKKCGNGGAFRQVLKKNSQLWTVMDSYGQLWTLCPFVISYLCSVKSGRYEGPGLP